MSRNTSKLILLFLLSIIVILAGCGKSTTDNSNITTAIESKNYDIAQKGIKTELSTTDEQVTIPETATAEPETVPAMVSATIAEPAPDVQSSTTIEITQEPAPAPSPVISVSPSLKPPSTSGQTSSIPISSTTDANNPIYVYNYNTQLQTDQVTYSKYITLGNYMWIPVSSSLSLQDKYIECYKTILANAVISGYPETELQNLITTILNNVKSDFLENGASYGIVDYNTYLSTVYEIASEADLVNYATAYARSYLQEKMILTMIAKKENITVTQAQFAATGAEIVAYYGYESYLEILETYGSEINLEVGYSVLSDLVINLVVYGSTGQ